MNSRHDSDQQRYSQAGEQAARFINELVSIAGEFSKKFDPDFNRSGDVSDTVSSASKEYRSSGGSADEWQKDEWNRAGEYLREMREAGGYTIDGFARAINRHDAERTIEAAEAGAEIFPTHWLQQASELLKQSDPNEFLDKLRNCYADDRQTHYGADKVNDVQSSRQQQLASVFSDSDALEGLTESQFEQLRGFMQSNYQSALKLVREQP